MREELGFKGEVASAIIKLQDSARKVGDGQVIAEIAEIKRQEIDFLLESDSEGRAKINEREIMCASALKEYCQEARLRDIAHDVSNLGGILNFRIRKLYAEAAEPKWEKDDFVSPRDLALMLKSADFAGDEDHGTLRWAGARYRQDSARMEDLLAQTFDRFLADMQVEEGVLRILVYMSVDEKEPYISIVRKGLRMSDPAVEEIAVRMIETWMSAGWLDVLRETPFYSKAMTSYAAEVIRKLEKKSGTSANGNGEDMP